jgi:hypothetical protein
MLAPSTTKLDCYLLSAVRDYLLNMFAATHTTSGGILMCQEPEDAPCRDEKGGT